jgi:hypothetical protein
VDCHGIAAAVVVLSVFLLATPAEAGTKKTKSKTSQVVKTAQAPPTEAKPKTATRNRGTRKAGTTRSPKLTLPAGLRPRLSIGAGPARLTLGTGGNRGTSRYRRRNY